MRDSVTATRPTADRLQREPSRLRDQCGTADSQTGGSVDPPLFMPEGINGATPVKGGGKTYHWGCRHLIRSRIRQVTFLLND